MVNLPESAGLLDSQEKKDAAALRLKAVAVSAGKLPLGRKYLSEASVNSDLEHYFDSHGLELGYIYRFGTQVQAVIWCLPPRRWAASFKAKLRPFVIYTDQP